MELCIKNISKSFGNKEVLKNISLTAKGGRAFGILGRNGAGKTTTIRILMNVISKNAGEILIDGKPIDYKNIKIGYLPEERGLYQKKKIIDQLVYFAELKGMKRKDAVNAVDCWLEKLQMQEYRNKRLDILSKGNQQKIQLITAVAHNPDIIILDEPFSGLDPVNAMTLEAVVKEEIHKGKIVLFSSHQMNYIEEFCDDIAILNQGQIALSGDLYEIKRNYDRNKLVIRTEESRKLVEELGEKGKLLNDRTVLVDLPSAKLKKSAMEYLISHYDIDEIKVYEPSLNDIFIEYAGKQEKGGDNETV